MINKNISFLSILLTASLLTGCATQTRRIDTTSNEGLVTIEDINFKDWQIAADKGVNSLLESGVVNRNDGRKTILMISTVTNSTNEHINTRVLICSLVELVR